MIRPLALGWSLGDLVIALIVAVAIIVIGSIALTRLGMKVPEWAVNIFWVVVVACVAILAIRFVMSV